MNDAEQSKADAPTIAPFDWSTAGHALVRAGETLDWNISDLSQFTKRVQLIEYGLSAEVEFAALLAWLGRCPLVHRLDQDYFSSQGDSKWQIPDLVAIFDHSGARAQMLIEVKTTRKSPLRMRTSDLRAKQQYAAELGLPLLIAWKPRNIGLWSLVDPARAAVQGNKSVFDLNNAMCNNLLGPVAGDFAVVPKAGAGIFFEAKLVKKTHETEDGFEGIAQLTNCEIRDSLGNPAKNVPGAIMAIILSSIELVDDWQGDVMMKSFVTRRQGLFAQQILRTAVAWRAKEGPIRWRHVAKELDSVLARDALYDEIPNHFGTFIQYQFIGHVKEWPDFLPAVWNSLPKQASE